MKTGHHIKILFLLLLLSSGVPLPSQTPSADSIKNILAQDRRTGRQLPDTAIIGYLNEIAYSVRNTIHDTALVYANEALLLAKRVGYKKGEARAKMIIGIVAIYEGHYNAGLDAHIEAIELYTALKDSIQVAFLLNNIGYLYKSQGKIIIAKDYFQRSLVIFRAKGFHDGIALVLGNLGDIALKRSEFQEALQLEKEALRYGNRSDDRFYSQLALFHLGTVFYAMGQHDSALAYQTQALKSFEQSGLGQYIVRSLENLSAIYAAKKQYTKAFEIANRGLSIADSLKTLVDIALMYERLSGLSTEMGDYVKALEYYRRTVSLRDSLISLNISERMKTLDMMRIAEKNAKELALAEKEQTRLALWRNFLLAGIGFIIILLVLIAHRYRYIARSEASLRKVNQVILQQQAQLEEQSKHIQEANTALEASNSELDAKNEHLTDTNMKLAAANERLAALNYEKDELLGIVAHDLKNPLTTIMMASSSLSAQNISIERVGFWGERILHTAERMLNIITKLLNINSLEQGAKILHVQSVDIIESIRQIIDDHAFHAQSKEIAVVFTSVEKMMMFNTDESIVVEIVENILDNALKYSPPSKSVYINLTREEALNEKKSLLRIVIQDEGPGFSEDDKTKIFGKFARLSAKPTAGEESTGLGLSIVKKLAEILGGSIALDSEFGKGARFTVIIPECSG